MSENTLESQSLPPEGDGAADENAAQAKLVPVGESIKYRRRAQQAESRIQEIEQQLNDLQTQVKSRDEQLTQAQSERDQARQQLVETTNQSIAQRLLNRAGVVDVDAASVLLLQRLDVKSPLDEQTLASGIEQLLLDKPFLRASAAAPLPPRTAAVRGCTSSAASRLSSTARRASRSGDRRDVAEYLRLRRAAALK